MSLSDPLGDMLTRIRNGQLRRKDSVLMPASRFRGNVLDVPSPGGIRVLCGSTDVGSAGLRWSATEVAGQHQTVCGNGGTLPTPGILHCHTFVWPEISTRLRDVS